MIKIDLSIAEKMVIFVDFQEKLMPAIAEKEKLEEKTIKFAQGVAAIDVPIIVTEQYKKGLGGTISSINDTFDGKAKYFDKTAFSAVKEEGFFDFVKKEGKHLKEVVICGIEAHICVLQTALDLHDLGYTVYVVEDCVGSRDLNDKAVAIQRMRDAGIIVTTFESALFEMLLHSKAEPFKAISNIIK